MSGSIWQTANHREGKGPRAEIRTSAREYPTGHGSTQNNRVWSGGTSNRSECELDIHTILHTAVAQHLNRCQGSGRGIQNREGHSK